MIRGEVWAIAHPSNPERTMRAVVLSTDAYNEGSGAFCAPVLRRPAAAGELPPWVVDLAERDPVSGVVIVARLARVARSAAVEPAGMLTGATLARCSDVLRSLFEL